MELKDYILVINKKSSKARLFISIISFILIILTILVTISGYQKLVREPFSSVAIERNLSLVLIVLNFIMLLIRNIGKHKLFKGFILFIPKALFLIIITFFIFLFTPNMSFFNVTVTGLYSLVLASLTLSLVKLFI
jgi:hypothetical protein